MNREATGPLAAFDELHGDSLDDLLDPTAPRRVVTVAAPVLPAAPAGEPCPKCGGSGVFRGYSGNSAGRCFKCKGSGRLHFKTPAPVRAQARASNAARHVVAVETWQGAHAAEWSWMQAAAGRGFNFAVAMQQAVIKYARLTDNQLAAIRRCMLRDAERDAQRNAERAAREEAAQVIDMTKITEAFRRAASILKFPRLRVAGILFSLPRAGSPARANGVVYARSEDRVYLGKISGGRFIRSRDCTDEQERAVLAAAVDPQEAAIRYGRLSGNCACCGRLLTAEDSLGRGIGPICAENFGW